MIARLERGPRPMVQDRPTVAMIFNVQTPYRLHLQRRLVRELSGVHFASLFTHDQAD